MTEYMNPTDRIGKRRNCPLVLAGLLAGVVAVVSLFPVNSTAAEPARKSAAAKSVIDPTQLKAPKRVIVPMLQGVLTLDGEFDEPVWSKAAVVGPFVISSNANPERESTMLRLWYDDTTLYLGWTCTDSDIQATFTEHDSRFWQEEVVELFITAKDFTRYFELEWDPLGGTFDAIIPNTLDERGVSKGINGDWTYTAKGMKSAVKVRGTVQNAHDKDESWQVEVAIPFADIGEAAPKPGDVWRGNFYRFSRGNGLPAEALGWTPTILPGFHQPIRFGYLEFGKQAAD
jgi:hypothetical protein